MNERRKKWNKKVSCCSSIQKVLYKLYMLSRSRRDEAERQRENCPHDLPLATDTILFTHETVLMMMRCVKVPCAELIHTLTNFYFHLFRFQISICSTKIGCKIFKFFFSVSFSFKKQFTDTSVIVSAKKIHSNFGTNVRMKDCFYCLFSCLAVVHLLLPFDDGMSMVARYFVDWRERME